jgi:hypothetical protein
VERRTDSGSWEFQLKEKTDHNQLEVSLTAGRYRYRIISYNALGRAAATSAWTPFRIYSARTPAAQKPKTINIPRDDKMFTLTLDGRDLFEGAELTLTGKNAVPVKPLFVRFADDDAALSAVFPTETLAAGKYDLVIINPGGLKQTMAVTIARPAPPQKASKNPQPVDGSPFLTVTESGVLFPVDRGWQVASKLGWVSPWGMDISKNMLALIKEAKVQYLSEVIAGAKRQILAIQVGTGEGIAGVYYQIGIREDIQNILVQSGGIRFKAFSDKEEMWGCTCLRGLYPPYSFTTKANQVVEITIPWFQLNKGSGMTWDRSMSLFLKNGDFSFGFEKLTASEPAELKIFDLEIYKGTGTAVSDERTRSSQAPVISKFVIGNREPLGNKDVTIFSKNNSTLYYEYSAADPEGDWSVLVHELKNNNLVFDASIGLDTESEFRMKTITNVVSYILDPRLLKGSCELSWYFLDKAGNKSQTIRKTITFVND